ncbi:hypothetical protein [Agrococcus sp. DT81.2]|uniref:hypothetical protein n=1 Tax=Agrococcus sp. DT81.2 TaxID=3393414 RepID=UPI003CE46850
MARMPDFAMPERAARVHGSNARLRSAQRPVERRPRSPFGWRHVAVAVLLGGVLGGSAAAGMEVAGRSAVDARESSLQALASEYLQAISDGDADRATRLSPLEVGRELAPQAVLVAAWRLTPLSVATAHVDGDEGSVDVRYRVGGTEVERTLRATSTAAGWRLETSLAEPPRASAVDATARLELGGVPLRGLHLYPAVYRLDVVEGPLFVSGGGVFAIDGDPGIATVVEASSELMPSFEQRLAELASVAVDTCRERPDCAIRTSAPFTRAGAADILDIFDDGRAIDVKVPLFARDDAGWEWRDVIVRVRLDSRGLPVEFLCSMPGWQQVQRCEP